MEEGQEKFFPTQDLQLRDLHARCVLDLEGEYQDPHMLVRDLRILSPKEHPAKLGYQIWLPVRDAVENILKCNHIDEYGIDCSKCGFQLAL